MPHWIVDALTLSVLGIASLVSVLSYLGTSRTQKNAVAEMQGTTKLRLDNVESDVRDVEADNKSQWREINHQGQRIAKLEGAD